MKRPYNKNKKDHRKVIQTTLPPNLKAQAKDWAKKTGVSVSQMVEFALADLMKDESKWEFCPNCDGPVAIKIILESSVLQGTCKSCKKPYEIGMAETDDIEIVAKTSEGAALIQKLKNIL